MEILRDLRMGVYDVVVGINLLREGLDLARSVAGRHSRRRQIGLPALGAALIQTIGRAARHVEGKVIMYAER